MYDAGSNGIQLSRLVRVIGFCILIMPTVVGGLLDLRAEFRDGFTYWGVALLITSAASLLMIPAVLFLVPTHWLGAGVGIRKRLSLALTYIVFFYLVTGTSFLLRS